MNYNYTELLNSNCPCTLGLLPWHRPMALDEVQWIHWYYQQHNISKRDVARLTSIGVRAHLHPLLHNINNIYTTLSLASPVPNSILFLLPISLIITHFSTPCLFQYKGIQLYLDIIVRLQGQEEIATLQWGVLVGRTAGHYVQQANRPNGKPC